MSHTGERLERLLAADLAECCSGDVEARLAELADLRAAARAPAADRRALSTLGDDTRHRLARALDAADGRLCVCELRGLVDVSESAVSHALSDLVEAGLATRKKEGRWRYYEATERTAALLDALAETREGA